MMHIPCDVEPWRDEEVEANNMVGEFYMPIAESRADLQSIQFSKLISLKSYWGLSKASIIYQAKHRNYINESTYKYFMIELGRRKERKNETGYVHLDEPQLLKQIISIQKEHFGYTEQDLANKLHLNINDYRRFFESQPSNIAKIRVLKPTI
jgi:Zn-dependent peptidase ImmA (M78 family)